MTYYREHNRDFDWKYEADNFVAKIKSATKRLHLKASVKVLPIISFSSSSAQKWSWLDRLKGEKKAETKVVGYAVRWAYRP